MVVLYLCRRNKKDTQNDSNCPQNNFSEFRQKFHDPLKLKKTLKSGFLYSLPGQNPNAAGGPGTTKRFSFSKKLLQGDALSFYLLSFLLEFSLRVVTHLK